MAANTGLRVKEMTPPVRQAAETLLGRSLSEDETIAIYAFPTAGLSHAEWEADLNDLMDLFPRSPLLSDAAISRERFTLAKTRCK